MKRPLRHIIATLFLMLCATMVHAQDLALRELTRLYSDGHYEQCIRKSLAYSSRHPDEPLAYLMVALPNLQLHFLNDGPDSDELLRDAMQYALEAHKRDKEGKAAQPYAWEMNELYRLIRQRGNDLYASVNKPTSAEYFKYLAEIYHDTTTEYAEFFAVTAAPVVKVAPTPSVADVPMDKLRSMIKYAETFMGIRYRISGTTEAGFDCSGYVRYVFANSNIDLPHSSQSMSELGREIPLRNAQPGDLIFFGGRKGKKTKVHHVGIVHDNDNGNVSFIHSSTSDGVTIDGPTTVSWDYWKGRILFVKRME